jgi:hypothetical protein
MASTYGDDAARSILGALNPKPIDLLIAPSTGSP